MRLFLIATSLLIPSVAAHAEGSGAPSIKSNDRWTYKNQVEIKGHFRETRVEYSVVRASPEIIAVSVKTIDSPQAPTEHLSGGDWSRFRSVNGTKTTVNRPLDFPLEKGKIWTVDYSEQNPNPQHKMEHYKTTYKVAGPEDVTVPAGTFHAIKIEANGEWTATLAPALTSQSGTRVNQNGSAIVMQTHKTLATTGGGLLYKAFWYVPPVKRWVKSTEEYYDANGTRTARYTEELESDTLSD